MGTLTLDLPLIPQAVAKARQAFNRNTTRSVEFRLHQLHQLDACLEENYDQFITALLADFHKPKFETVVTEIEFARNAIKYELEHIHGNVKPQKAKRPMANLLDNAYVKYDPYGLVLLFSAWNYPIQLLLCPLAGAIAAGNAVVIKPSEVVSNTEQLLAKLLPKYLDNDCFPVLTGGADVATQLLQERFDLIFYTGSPAVGKLIYQAASQYMTPVILELGGKSPVYIDDSVSGQLEVAAKRILWGRLINAGQTCVAPDYILCSPGLQKKLVQACIKVLKDFYTSDPKSSVDYPRIVNDRNYYRLKKLLDGTKGKIVAGGQLEPTQRYIAPTLVINVPPTDSLMSEELFGPILPVVPVRSEEDAIRIINSHEKPLTMYLFTKQKATVAKFLEQTSSGSVCVNDTIMQMICHTLPFGGVGNSGIGKYHGKYSFEAFSHSKAVLEKDFNPVLEYFGSSRYPPYTEAHLKMLTFLAAPNFLDRLNYRTIGTVVGSFALGVATMFSLSMIL